MKKTYLFIISCIFIYNISLNAQNTTTTLYEFEYQFPNQNKSYSALLIRNKNGSGNLRIRYIDPLSQKPVCVVLDLDEHFDVANSGYTPVADTNVLCFVGENQKIIFGNSSEAFTTTTFRFRKSPKTGIYEPIEVMYRDFDNFQYFKTTPTKKKLIEAADLTPPFVAKYYSQDESVFLNGKSASSNDLAVMKNAHLYFISVANTKALGIGTSCTTDRDAMSRIFEAIAKKLTIPFIFTDISGDNFGAEKVNTALKNIKPNSTDIVIFYYSGHGFEDRSETVIFPRLDLRNGDFDDIDYSLELQIQDIYQMLLAKKARFTLVLSDCCNAKVGAQVPVTQNAPTTRSSPIPFSDQICRTLFLNPKPYAILMAAAAKGEVAAGFESDGGIFTFNFRETLVNLLSPLSKITDVSWDKIIDQTVQGTVKKAPDSNCPENIDPTQKCSQHPIQKN